MHRAIQELIMVQQPHLPMNRDNIKDKIMMAEIKVVNGCRYYPDFLGKTAQKNLLAHIRMALIKAPLFQPTMPRTGKPFSVSMSNMGPLGWVSDKDQGYRYQATHPQTGQFWPQIPSMLQDLWNDLAKFTLPPEACLINYYNATARMGLHRDDDEHHLQAPILSISLGDKATFRLGGSKRNDPTCTLTLQSGDIVILEPPLRDAYHGIDRIFYGSSRLVVEGGRFNLTLRRVNPA